MNNEPMPTQDEIDDDDFEDTGDDVVFILQQLGHRSLRVRRRSPHLSQQRRDAVPSRESCS